MLPIQLANRRNKAFFEKKVLKYKRLKEEVINHTKQLRCHYINSIQQMPSKDTWKAINVVSRRQNSSSRASDRLSLSDLNDFFASTQQKATNHPKEDFSPSCLPSKPLSLSVSEVERLLSSTKQKSCGPDGIPF